MSGARLRRLRTARPSNCRYASICSRWALASSSPLRASPVICLGRGRSADFTHRVRYANVSEPQTGQHSPSWISSQSKQRRAIARRTAPILQKLFRSARRIGCYQDTGTQVLRKTPVTAAVRRTAGKVVFRPNYSTGHSSICHESRGCGPGTILAISGSIPSTAPCCDFRRSFTSARRAAFSRRRSATLFSRCRLAAVSFP